MKVDINFVLAAGAFLLNVIGFVWIYFKVLMDLTSRLVRLETQIEPMWDVLGEGIKALVKQPIHFRKDELLDKLFPDGKQMTNDELLELKALLNLEMPDLMKEKKDKIMGYSLALFRIAQLLRMRGCGCEADAPHLHAPRKSWTQKIARLFQ